MPLLWLSMAFLAGILLADGLDWSLRGWALLAGILLGLSMVGGRLRIGRLRVGRLRGRRLDVRRLNVRRLPVGPIRLDFPIPLPVLLLAVSAGGARYQSAQPRLDPGFIAWYNDTQLELVVVGVVAAPPDERDTYTNLKVRVEQVRPADGIFHTAVSGSLLGRLPPGGDWRYGDRLALRGQLETPPTGEAFSYQDYLARQGVYSYMPRARAARLAAGVGNPLLRGIYSLRARALSTVYRLFPDPEASLLAGILLGVETGIPATVQAAFKDTGTSHIIAISGFNLTLLAGLFTAAFGRLLGPRRGSVATGLGISAYTVLVGADAAVVRAALMAGLSLLARQVGRRQAALNSLAVSAALMTLFNPRLPWDVGFQLSFAATLGLVLYADPLSQSFQRMAARLTDAATARRLAGPVGEYCLFTLAALATTLPITAYHFQRLSWSALLANPAILPVQPAVMVLGGISVGIGIALPPLGALAARLTRPFVAYTIRAVELLARLPGVLHLGRVSLLAVCGYYGLLLLGTLGAQHGRPAAMRLATALRPGLGLSALIVLAVVVWQAALAAPDGRLHLTVLDVGTGDGLLIRSPTGRYVLVDGGPLASQLSEALGRRLPLGRREIDYLVVAAPSAEQVGALPQTLARFSPAAALWAAPPGASRSARDLREALTTARVPVAQA